MRRGRAGRHALCSATVPHSSLVFHVRPPIHDREVAPTSLKVSLPYVHDTLLLPSPA